MAHGARWQWCDAGHIGRDIERPGERVERRQVALLRHGDERVPSSADRWWTGRAGVPTRPADSFARPAADTFSPADAVARGARRCRTLSGRAWRTDRGDSQ